MATAAAMVSVSADASPFATASGYASPCAAEARLIPLAESDDTASTLTPSSQRARLPSVQDFLEADATVAATAGDDFGTYVSERISQFTVTVTTHKSEFERSFPADKLVQQIIDNHLKWKMRELANLNIHGEDELARCALANRFLCPELALPKTPRYSVRFVQDNACEQLVFQRRLFSGWCVNIDSAVFQALAFGEGLDSLPAKASERVHMLCVRGRVIQDGLLPDEVLCRSSLTVACDRERCHQLDEEAVRWKNDAAERVRCMGFDDAGVPIITTALSELELREEEIEAEVVIEGGSNNSTSCCLSPSHVESCLFRWLAAADENLDSIMDAFQKSLLDAHFEEKLAYWRALRSGESTSEKLLTQLFDVCLGNKSGNAAGFPGAREISEKYMREYATYSKNDIAMKLVQWQASGSFSTGFATGFGGLLTMPLTVPAGLLATWMTSTRLAFAVAHVYGHDIFHPIVANAVLYCLTGSGPGDDKKSAEVDLRDRLRQCRVDANAHPSQLSLVEELASPQGSKDSVSEAIASRAGMPQRHADPASMEFQATFATLYDLLGVASDASQQQIRAAYRRLALQQHPDKLASNASQEQLRAATQSFQVLSAAYEELSDPVRRAAYDKTLHEGNWTWASFQWDKGLDRAREAWTRCGSMVAKNADVSGHAATRAVAVAGVDLAQVGVTAAIVRGAGGAEIRTSIVAGEKMAASATARSASKVIPVLGALVSGAVDCAMTASVGRCSLRVFTASS